MPASFVYRVTVGLFFPEKDDDEVTTEDSTLFYAIKKREGKGGGREGKGEGIRLVLHPLLRCSTYFFFVFVHSEFR